MRSSTWKLATSLLTCAIGLAVSTPALADTVFYSGALTTSDPTFDNPGGSSAGSGVHYYDVTVFTVSLTGAYTFEMASPNTLGTPSNALDTYMRIYATAFNPATPSAPAAIASNDDFTGTLTVLPGSSGFPVTSTATGFSGAQPSSRLANVNLTAGTTYFLVNTSFRETNYVATGTNGQSTGTYYQGITGPGTITIVPAPGAFALLGLAGAVGARRRRRA